MNLRYRLRGLSIGLLAVMMATDATAAATGGLPFRPLPDQPPIPADNPMTEVKIALGKQLYFDPRLSVTGTHSCNSCHDVTGSGSDGRQVSSGVNDHKGRRNTLTIWNAAYHTVYNWDGSAKTLEEQFRGHLLDENIMGMDGTKQAVERIAGIPAYRNSFVKAFPGEGLSFDNLAKAVSAYVRTLVTTNSPYDRYLKGERKAISTAAARGFQTFIDIRCASCHFWVNLSGPNPGLALQQGEGFYELFPNYPGSDYEQRYKLADDLGRYYVTKDETDRRMWRLPSLRNIALTAPYFHSGTVGTLPEAVKVMAKVQLKRELTEQQLNDIVAFLNTLTGEFPKQTPPELPGISLSNAASGH